MSTIGSKRTDVGFNYQQPGKIKKADWMMLISALVIIAGLVIWATR